MDSEGLLLLTDDGELTQLLLHPSHQVEKEYLVWVTGNINKALPILSAPMALDGEELSPAQVRRGRDSGGVHQLSMVIHQGKNRQVRRMCAQAGLEVLRLKRVREGGLFLDRSLKPGQWRPLTGEERLTVVARTPLSVAAPVVPGQVIGTLCAYLEGEEVAAVDLVAVAPAARLEASSEDAGWWTRMFRRGG